MTKQIAVLIALLLALAVLHPVAIYALFALALAVTAGVWALLLAKVIGNGRRYSYSHRAHP